METAIIGLDTYFGTCGNGREFARAVAHGLRCKPASDALRGVELALRVADNALFDADVPHGARTAVVWAGDATVAAEIAALWGFGRPTLAVIGGAAALVEAQRLLADGAVDVVLIGETGAAGGVALVLTRAEDVAGRIYAVIQSSAGFPACEQTGMSAPHLPGYREWSELTEGMLPTAASALEPTCALGSVSTNLGDDAPALATLARTALCLYHRVIPATPDWRGPRDPRNDSPFYVAPAAQPWLVDNESVRTAYCVLRRNPNGLKTSDFGLSTLGLGLILTEPIARPATPVIHTHLSARPFYLFPLAADDREGILVLADDLRWQAARGAAVETLADDALAAYQTRPDAQYALALLAHDREELLRELDFAIKGVDKAFTEGKDWTSPLGSSFTAQPQGRTSKVAFVYPGAFSSYVGMGRDLFQLFPHLHARFAEVTRYTSRATAEKLLYPRRLYPPTETDVQADDAHLHANPTAMIESGASSAILYTSALRDVFGVEPAAALGYSLGEVSMLWALGVWPDGDAGSDAWNATPLFKTRLFGPQDAVREYWGLGGDAGDALWCSYIVKAPVERVRWALKTEPRAYLTIVNEEKEAVIAGHPDACARVITALDCHALRMPFSAAIHAPAMRSEYTAFVDLYALPTHAVPGIDFYSAAEYAPLALERDALAHALAKMTCAPVDFPRLVRAAYDAGARIFVELGPLGACSRWIDRILRDRPHAVVPINKSGKSDYDSLLPVLAMLVTQRVKMKQEARGRIQDARITSYELRITNHASHITNYTIESHLAFLQAREAALRQTAELMTMQISAAGKMMQESRIENQESKISESASRRITNNELRIANHPSPSLPLSSSLTHPLFIESHLHAFATGEVTAAFGPAYAHYRGRRVPRLPNGDLLCVSRVLAIDGAPGKVASGAALVSEFDARADAWFFRDRAALPTAVLMEIALQPCGVLSTYLDSMLPYPESDFYFRNLDGEGELLRAVDVRGQTIANRVTLLSSTALPGIILQKFSFELACAGEIFYRGAAAFGYFTPEALQRQAGLDNGAVRRPWLTASTEADVPLQSVGIERRGPLDFLDKAWCVPNGGEYGHGYVYAEVPVSPDDWFFGCHFYQDPVMPGSLGVEAMVQAMQVYARAQRLGTGMLHNAPGRMVWKYRGQVPPTPQRLRLEVHIKNNYRTPEGVALVGDGSLWKGDLRIYEVRNIGSEE